MHFARPDNLYLLLMLVPMVLAIGGYFWWKRRIIKRVGHDHLIRAMAARHSNRRQVARAVLVVLAAALLGFAAAQPQWGQNDRTVKRMGVDVVFALDLSNSMLAQDIPPSRLQAAKDEIRTSMTTLSGDRVGLVVFTAISFSQSPLTTDYGAIRFYLDKLQPRQMPVGGTSVGQAIMDSVELLTGEKINHQTGEAKDDGSSEDGIDRADNQVIVLITDGEDHESSPLEAARIARDRGIRVVTVGMGSSEGGRIPIYGKNGQLKGYKRDQKGELVFTRLDEKTLRGIATETGGTYLRYSGEHSVVNGLERYIQQLEKSELEAMLRKSYKNRFMYFLAPALLLLIIAMLLGERRRRETGAPQRDDRKSAGSIFLVLLVLFALTGLVGCDDAFRGTVSEVDRANQLIAQNKYEEALEQYREAEKVVPSSSELHYNRGIAHLGAEEFDKAREAFARALESPDPELRFDALFNLGLALAGQQEWKEAYGTYKRALGIDLDEQRPQNRKRIEQARHNLEVVFRKLFPPCSELEDEFEENDEPEAASELAELSAEDVTLCGLDDDWFVIPAMVGTSVSVEASFDGLREEPDPEHVFLPRPQDLQLSVFDALGEEVLAVDQGSPEDFEPDATSATRSIEKFTVTPEMVADGKSYLLLKVQATDAREFAYDVEVTAIPPCEALDDEHEENDTRSSAAVLSAGNHELHICPGQDDWYAVDLEMGDTLFVDVAPGQDRERERPPSLDVQIVNADTGEVVSEGRSEEPFITAGVGAVAQDGRYLVRVFGQSDDEQGPYTTDIYHYEPCVVGDDRYEENDTASQAAEFEQGAQTHRYLRICDSDRDFFRLPPREDDQQAGGPGQAPAQAPGQSGSQSTGPASDDDEDLEVSWGLTVVEDETAAEVTPSPDEQQEAGRQDRDAPDDPTAPPSLDIMSHSGDQILAEGVVPKVVAAKDDADKDADAGDDESAAPPGIDRMVSYENTDNEELLLRVQGRQAFYHLTELNPQKQDDQKKDDQNKDDQNKDDQNKDDQKKDDQNKDDQKKDDQKKDDQKKDDQKKDDQKKDDQKKDDQKEKDKKDEQSRQSQPKRPEPRDPEERRIDDIMRALEESDDNFQMKKALEDMPRRYIEKDW